MNGILGNLKEQERKAKSAEHRTDIQSSVSDIPYNNR